MEPPTQKPTDNPVDWFYLTDTSVWLDRQPQYSTSTASSSSMVAGADGMASLVSNGSFKYSNFAQYYY